MLYLVYQQQTCVRVALSRSAGDRVFDVKKRFCQLVVVGCLLESYGVLVDSWANGSIVIGDWFIWYPAFFAFGCSVVCATYQVALCPEIKGRFWYYCEYAIVPYVSGQRDMYSLC